MAIAKTIYLCSPRGFCAGVDRAIETVEKAIEVYGTPLYVHHEIVHNQHVVNSLREKGVIFVEDLAEVPANDIVIFSAHGVSPAIWEEASARNLTVIDATCPLVTRVHLGARRYASQDFCIVFIGHRKHVETIGTLGEAPDRITIIENAAEVDSLDFAPDQKIAYLTQTTLSLFETKEIIDKLKQRFPHIQGPGNTDICYATTNRQQAVAEISPRLDLMLVIGSRNSSNSNRLKEVAEKNGCMAYLIDGPADIKEEWFQSSPAAVGLTAGASAPEILVAEVIERLQTDFGFARLEEVKVTSENVSFQLPELLRLDR